MPETVAQAFYSPCEWQNKPASATEVIGNHAGDHDDKVTSVKPKELCPRVFRPPMLTDFLDKAATQQGFINHVDDMGSNHEPEREDQRNVHTVVAPAQLA